MIAASPSPVHVLIVEDDDVEIMALRRALKNARSPHTLTIAHDGVEALAKLRGEGCAPLERPSLIFLDLNLPRMNGHEFLRELRRDAQYSQTDVIVVTTSAAEEDQREAFGSRVAGYIVKSTFGSTFEDFVRQIDVVLEKSYVTRGHLGGPSSVLLVTTDEREPLLRASLSELPRLSAVHSQSEALDVIDTEEVDCLVVDVAGSETRAISFLDAAMKRMLSLPAIVFVSDRANVGAIAHAMREGGEDWILSSQLGGDALYRAVTCAFERNRQRRFLTESNTKLERLACLDPLTELLNRRGFERALAAELSRAARTGATLYAIVADCDDFKRINESYGHSGGDAVLREVASRFVDSLRKTDHVARVGGDEFLAILPGASEAEAGVLAQRLRDAVANEAIYVSGVPIRHTVSVVFLPVPSDARTVTDVLRGSRHFLSREKAAHRAPIAATGSSR
jgi:two-component system cell cycle response regulator